MTAGKSGLRWLRVLFAALIFTSVETWQKVCGKLIYLGWYDDSITNIFTSGILFNSFFSSPPGNDWAFINALFWKGCIYINQSFGRNDAYYHLSLLVNSIWLTAFLEIIWFRSKQRFSFISYTTGVLSLILILPAFCFPNYTMSAIICTVLGFLYINSCSRYNDLLYGGILLLLGALMRYQSALLIAGLILPMIMLNLASSIAKFRQNPVKLLIAFLIYLIVPCFNSMYPEEERNAIELFNQYNFTANDAYLTKFIDPSDSLALLDKEALLSWNSIDDLAFDTGRLNSLTFSHPFQWAAFNNISAKVKMALASLSQFKEYTTIYNLGPALMISVIWLIVVAFTGLFKELTNRFIIYLYILFILSFMLFLKWEYRLLVPIIAGGLLYISDRNKHIASGQTVKCLLLAILLFYARFQSSAIIKSFQNKSNEARRATILFKHIKENHPGSVIVLDLNSIVIPDLIDKTDSNLQFITNGEYWTIFYDAFKKYYSQNAGGVDLYKRLKYLESSPEILLFYSEYKANFTSRYFKLRMNQKFNIEQDEKDILHSTSFHFYLPSVNKFSIYRLKSNEE